MLTHGNHKSKLDSDVEIVAFFGVLYGWCRVCYIICMMFEDSTGESPNGHRQHILTSDVLSKNPSGVV